jgi:hypothetical protein
MCFGEKRRSLDYAAPNLDEGAASLGMTDFLP